MTVQLKILQELIQQSVPSEKATLYQNLVTVLYDSSTTAFLESLDEKQFTQLSLGSFDFLDSKAVTKPRIRVYTPSNRVNGWEAAYSVIEINLKDRPFIIDSVRMLLRKEGIRLHHLIHPILTVSRDSEGHLKEIYLTHSDIYPAEVYQLFLVDQLDKRSEDRLCRKVREVLNDVVAATDDYQAMRGKCREIRSWLTEIRSTAGTLSVPHPIDGLNEYIDFFDWLDEDNYVFLGYREYESREGKSGPEICVKEGSGLGILRKIETSKYYQPVSLSDLSPDQTKRMTGPPLVLITKTNAESTVHRLARMDYISVKELDEKGEFLSERRLVGLFTSKAFTSPTKHIPILRRKLNQILAIERVRTGSHDFKQIVSIFDSIPRSELFWLDVNLLHRDIQVIMGIEQQQGVRVLRRFDPLHRGIALMVVMPRDRFNSSVRQQIQNFLAHKLQATHVDYHLAMIGGDESQVRFHFFFSTTLSYDEIDFKALDREVADMTRSWEDRLNELLQESFGSQIISQAEGVIQLLPEGYRAEVPVEEAVRDIKNLLEMDEAPYRIELHNSDIHKFPEDTSFLRIYHRSPLNLNQIFPVLENLGFRIIEQISYPCTDPKNRSGSAIIDIFRVQDDFGNRIEIEDDGSRLEEALLRVLIGDVKNDPINQLVLNAGLWVREAGLLRAYRSYLSQVSAATSSNFITETLLGNPESAACLFHFFDSKFSLSSEPDRPTLIKNRRRSFLDSLDSVSTLPEDEVLRFLYRLIDSTARTNYYLEKPYVSLKIESHQLQNIPEPRPFCEIFVESPELEAIHLRGGKVARGGLRWSDRPDDFRTEILGLMKTQMTKNTLIVPVGSKGGFVLKDPPADIKGLKDHVREQYKTFIRGLLDLTDNIIESKVVHPRELVIYDDPDPYLVVAADKGTATLSDTANQISEEYNFWLGDAFASGGSYGYDHKREGITARGAWECVRRHFWELGINPFKDEFTVLGIGDMSGDVFGNGMIYTDKIRLLAAFNHRHIFVDPDPDPDRSYEERRRLFKNPMLDWSDYNPRIISPGGGVFPRHAKSVQLTPEIKKMLKIDVDELSGQDLVRHLLRLNVDLLWNGGIGTYIKATPERNSEVGDPSNNPVRINATELEAKVVGEGGNLGLTQLGRIEYALKGGKINTDAIDNSGGVDMSDHEVNIKILLQSELVNKNLEIAERNSLLQEMTDEVTHLVLENNYSQTLCLSLAERNSREALTIHSALQGYLEETAGLKPAVECLPDQAVLDERSKSNQGYSRPELSILLAYTKMNIKQILLQSLIPDEPILQKYLNNYFPRILQDRFAQSIEKHPLRREIVATQLTNRLVDRIGLDFIFSIFTETGVNPADAIQSVLATYETLDLDPFFERLFSCDRLVSPDDFYSAISEVVEACRGVAQWILFSDSDTTGLTPYVSHYRSLLISLRDNLENLLPAAEKGAFLKLRDKALKQGFPEDLSHLLAATPYLPSCIGVIDVNQATRTPLETTAKSYYSIGDRLKLGWLRDQLARLKTIDQWEAVALGGIIMDLRNVQTGLTVHYLNRLKTESDLSIQKFFNLQTNLIDRIDHFFSQMDGRRQLDLAGGVVAARLLNQLMKSLEPEKGSHRY